MLSHYTALGASPIFFFFFFNDTATTEIYTLSLHDALPISFVDFDHGLNNAINRLREALGDSVEKPAYIETIPRRGYRFIAAVGDTGPAPLQEFLKEAPAGLDALTDPASPTAKEGIPRPATAARPRRVRSV